MAALASSWRAQLENALNQRNQLEGSFAGIIDSHNLLLRQNSQLRSRNTDLEKKVIILTHTAQDGGAEQTPESLRRLEDQIRQLQGELTEKYRSEAHSANAQLSLTAEAQQLQRSVESLKDELDVCRAALGKSEAREHELRELAESREAEMNVLRTELLRTRELLEVNEKSVRGLTSENQQLVERLLAEKLKVAEEMNKMNNIIEDLKGKLASPVRRASEGLLARFSRADSIAADAAAAASAAEAKAGAGQQRSRSAVSYVSPPTRARSVVRAHGTEVNTVCYNDDGSIIATGSSDGCVKLWDARSGRMQSTLHAGRGGKAVMCVSVKGRQILAGCSDRNCRVWALDTQRLKHTLTGHAGKIYSCFFAPDGRRAVTGSTDRTLKVWDMSTGYCVRTITGPSIVNALCVSDDGSVLVSGHQDGAVRVWDIRNGAKLAELRELHTSIVTSVALSPGGGNCLLSVSRDNSLQLTDSRSFQPLAQLSHSEFRAGFNWSRAIFSPDAAYVAAGGGDGSLFLWNSLSRKSVAVLRSHSAPVPCVAWSPAGSQVASVDKAGNLVIWE